MLPQKEPDFKNPFRATKDGFLDEIWLNKINILVHSSIHIHKGGFKIHEIRDLNEYGGHSRVTKNDHFVNINKIYVKIVYNLLSQIFLFWYLQIKSYKLFFLTSILLFHITFTYKF